ncbi:MAG: deoxyribodipyrimidine photolyase [Saprospirales bacterium]|nr:deoxyribodipyrimidine photolyase [Saprospirales bacterium]
MKNCAIFWFRRDLRLEDNAGLYHALRSGLPVLPIFIFDTNILDELPDRDDARVTFIHREVSRLSGELKKLGSSLLVLHGKPLDIWQELIKNHQPKAVFTNSDYEPYARERDAAVEKLLKGKGIPFYTFKDQVIFEKDEVLKDNGEPYTVFTPYSKKWKQKLDLPAFGQNSPALQAFPSEKYLDNFLKIGPQPLPSLEALGFKASGIEFPPKSVPQKLIMNYDKTRDFPGLDATSRLGVHFRFGTISIREKARKALQLNQTFLNELIWREFYSMILWHFPQVVTNAFKPKYDLIRWRNDEEDFRRWCEGLTGFPLVDAGMRQLKATGHMHNRVRMLAASFLTKDLLIDWRWGEAWFARYLLDFELASNNGGWQWAAGCGTDAAPYFRIFNPETQLKKFDPDLTYVKKWIPEYGTSEYPAPMLDHSEARKRCLEVYREALR